MTSFRDQQSTQKGTLGERIGERWLRKCGYYVYKPADLDSAHPIDRMAVQRSSAAALVCDFKAKPRREFYPDTGIDVRHWLTYLILARINGMRALLVFVDEIEAKVYGGFLDDLDRIRPVKTQKGTKYYPITQNTGESEIRYFPLIAMQEFGDLTEQECAELRQRSSRNPIYDEMARGRAMQGRLL